MDSSTTTHSFSINAPFQYTVTIIHFIAMSVVFIGCYPYAFTQQMSQHSHKRRLISLGIGVSLALVGLVTSWFIQYPSSSSSSIIYSCLTFGLFCLISFDLVLEYIRAPLSRQQQHQTDTSHHQHHHEQQPNNNSTRLYLWVYQLPPVVRMSLIWITLCLGYFYLALGVLVLSLTCESLGQCWLPLATGAGFLLSGSLALLHLVGIFVLPPHATSEYYEAIWILIWGCLSFFWWDMSVVESSWKGIDFGILWSTGGLLSLVMTFQTWLPFLQKRNIVNSIIICLTGKGILSGHSENDFYAMNLQGTLGYILIIGSAARFTHIMFRKTETDTLPRLYSRIFGTNRENCDDDGTCVNDLDIGRQQRSNDYETTYRQLTGMNPTSTSSTACKHQSVYASISMVCGLLSCFTTISGGFFFIGTMTEWLETMQYYISDSTTYVNVLLAMAFLWISYLTILCSIYKYSAESADGYKYDYFGVATGDDYGELPVSTKLSSSSSLSASPITTLNFDTNNMTPTSSISTTYDPTTASQSSIPLGTLGSSGTSTKHHYQASQSSSTTPTSNGTATNQVMRPSQYRAKRRSLLVSTNVHHHDNGTTTTCNRGSRTLSTSSYTGVGGILPDDIYIYSNGEQYISSPIHSATMSEQQPLQVNHSYPAIQQYQQHQQCHSPTLEPQSWPSVTSTSKDDEPEAKEHHRHQCLTILKTESGKRKERQWKKSKRRRAAATSIKSYTQSTDDQDDDDTYSHSDGSDDGPGQLDYSYSSDLHSSDSHI